MFGGMAPLIPPGPAMTPPPTPPPGRAPGPPSARPAGRPFRSGRFEKNPTPTIPSGPAPTAMECPADVSSGILTSSTNEPPEKPFRISRPSLAASAGDSLRRTSSFGPRISISTPRSIGAGWPPCSSAGALRPACPQAFPPEFRRAGRSGCPSSSCSRPPDRSRRSSRPSGPVLLLRKSPWSCRGRGRCDR